MPNGDSLDKRTGSRREIPLERRISHGCKLAACQESLMDTETSRKIVLDYLAAQGRGDGEAMATLLADDVVWRPPQSAGFGTPTGRDVVLSTMAEAGPKFFDLSTMKIEVKWVLAEGDKVVIRQSATAKATNGRDYDNEYVWVYTCKDGQISEIEEHVDSQKFKEIVLDD
jgi:ketosteroid isomerase-like protein